MSSRSSVCVEEAREQLDARAMAQIQAVDLQAVREGFEVGFAREALRGVARKARGDDHARAGAQHHQRGLVADLQARAGDQRGLADQRRRLEALLVVELRARLAHRVVEEVQPAVLRLAHVAAARVLQLAHRRASSLPGELRRRLVHGATGAPAGSRSRRAARDRPRARPSSNSAERPCFLGSLRGESGRDKRPAAINSATRASPDMRDERRAVLDQLLQDLDATRQLFGGKVCHGRRSSSSARDHATTARRLSAVTRRRRIRRRARAGRASAVRATPRRADASWRRAGSPSTTRGREASRGKPAPGRGACAASRGALARGAARACAASRAARRVRGLARARGACARVARGQRARRRLARAVDVLLVRGAFRLSRHRFGLGFGRRAASARHVL